MHATAVIGLLLATLAAGPAPTKPPVRYTLRVDAADLSGFSVEP